MKVVFINSASNDNVIAYLNKVNKIRTNYVQQKWDYAFSLAMYKLLKDDFIGLSVSSVSSFPIRSRCFYNKEMYMPKSNTTILKSFNLPFVKQWMYMTILRRKLTEIVKEYKSEGVVFVTNCIQYISAHPVFEVAKKYQIKVLSIVPDLPDFDMCSYPGPSFIINKYKSLNLKYEKDYDGYICFSKHQMKYLNPNAPYIVMEGFCDCSSLPKQEIKKSPKFVVMYAGGVRKAYGIKELVDGFIKANINNSELWIFGDGDYVPELKEIRYSSVKYMDIVDKQDVLKYEQEASLLVNPRPSHETFSYLSFPSKILEYMASGTTLLTSHLGSIPAEYDDYLLYFDEISADGIAEKLSEIYSLSNYQEIGVRAQKFVQKNKNTSSQAERVVEFIRTID